MGVKLAASETTGSLSKSKLGTKPGRREDVRSLLSVCLLNIAGKVRVRGCVYKCLPACKVKRGGEELKTVYRLLMNDSKVEKHSVRAVHTVQV